MCLGGVAIDALKNVLSTNEQISKVYMCVDRDDAGDKTVKRIGDELNEMGYEWERIFPENKDWNEDLTAGSEQNEIRITAKEKRTINNLTAALDKGHPVLMCIQAWAASDDGYNTENPDDEDTYLTEGHWVICVGYKKLDSGYTFYFNDPACVGYCLMSEEELDDRWIDMDTGGNIYNHYGIEINETGQDYNPKGVYHLD